MARFDISEEEATRENIIACAVDEWGQIPEGFDDAMTVEAVRAIVAKLSDEECVTINELLKAANITGFAQAMEES